MKAALADRIEATGVASRELDGAIEVAREPTRRCILHNEPGPFPQKPVYGTIAELVLTGNDLAEYISAPAYTSSFDAAVSLVPAGKRRIEFGSYEGGRAWAYVHTDKDVIGESDDAPTEAAAICAAALRAMEAQS